jgi:hypothetical protein
MTWLLLALQLPAQPAYLRVKIWRRLQGVGAISYRNALYLLPASDSTVEDFEWILREVRAGGGDGAVFDSRLVNDTGDQDLRALFDAAREQDYQALAEELRAAAVGVEQRRGTTDSSDPPPVFARIRRRLKEIEAIDIFNANGRESVHALLRKLEMITPAPTSEAAMTATNSLSNLSGRTWVTRSQVRVDRMASAWLIQRKIDPEARFKFVGERQYLPAAQELRFDMYEAEYTHDAERCTFEVLLDLIPEKDDALQAIAEIVHDLDLKDQRYNRAEAPGVKQLLAGIIAGSDGDRERLQRSAVLFDDLYRAFAGPRR